MEKNKIDNKKEADKVDQEKPITEINLKCDATLFKKVIACQSSIKTDGSIIRFYKDHIEFKDVDPAHVIMVTQTIENKVLLEYYYLNDNNELYFDLAIDLNALNDILKASDKNDIVKFTYNSNELQINISYGLFKHKLNVLDYESIPYPKLPNLSLPASFIIDTKTFKTFIDQALKISDYMTITTNNNGLNLNAANIDSNNNVNLDINKDMLKEFYSNSKHSSKFSNDYLSSILKHIVKLFKDIKIKIGDDNPLELSSNEKTIIQVLLAPRIESE